MSDLALGKSVFGTDALSIPKLFSVDGWVAVGMSHCGRLPEFRSS